MDKKENGTHRQNLLFHKFNDRRIGSKHFHLALIFFLLVVSLQASWIAIRKLFICFTIMLSYNKDWPKRIIFNENSFSNNAFFSVAYPSVMLLTNISILVQWTQCIIMGKNAPRDGERESESICNQNSTFCSIVVVWWFSLLSFHILLRFITCSWEYNCVILLRWNISLLYIISLTESLVESWRHKKWRNPMTLSKYLANTLPHMRCAWNEIHLTSAWKLISACISCIFCCCSVASNRTNGKIGPSNIHFSSIAYVRTEEVNSPQKTKMTQYSGEHSLVWSRCLPGIFVTTTQ